MIPLRLVTEEISRATGVSPDGYPYAAMMRRSVRILVLLLTVAVTAGVVWRATMNEQVRGRMRLAAQQTDALAADAIFELIDLRSTLHAYVAPGQGEAFWAGRRAGQLASLRGRLRELEPASTAANHPLTTALASLDGLAAVEARARASVRDSQSLVAGDIIFTEARDLIDSAARDVSDARQAMARATSAREAGMANEQSLLAGALMAAWIFALILLVPVPRREIAAVVQPVVTTEQGGLSLHLRDMTSSPPPNRERSAAAVAPVAPAAPVAAPAPAPVPPAALVAPVAVLESLASLCADIARVSNVGELGPLLGRAAALVGARGVVVWLAAGGGQELVPAVSHGYDENMLARLGPIRHRRSQPDGSCIPHGRSWHHAGPGRATGRSGRAAALGVRRQRSAGGRTAGRDESRPLGRARGHHRRPARGVVPGVGRQRRTAAARPRQLIPPTLRPAACTPRDEPGGGVHPGSLRVRNEARSLPSSCRPSCRGGSRS